MGMPSFLGPLPPSPLPGRKIHNRPAAFYRQGPKSGVRVDDSRIFHPFQKRKVGDAVGVKGTPAHLSPQHCGESFGPEYLSVAEAKGFNVVSGEKPLADFKLGGQDMRNAQVSGQRGNRVSGGVGNDHHPFPWFRWRRTKSWASG